MNINETIKNLSGGNLDDSLLKAYDKEELSYAKERFKNLLSTHSQNFGEGDAIMISAPGRSEILGNHTDHNMGCVIAAAINLDIIAVVTKSNNMNVTVCSEGFAPFSMDISNLDVVESEKGTSQSLIRGILKAYSSKCHITRGFNATISSIVPKGSGLSSSAAFEVLMCNIVNSIYIGTNIDPVEAAMFSQMAENVYFGKPCGLMDQTACSVGGFTFIDFSNTSAPHIKQLVFDFNSLDCTLCIVDTKGSHDDLTEDYASIPFEMKSVANVLGVSDLGFTTKKDLINNLCAIRTQCGDRAVMRAFHFFDENERVNKVASNIKSFLANEYLSIVQSSGDSSLAYLQNLYAVKNPKSQGLLLGIYLTKNFLNNKGACRVHGGGFEGTIQSYVPKEMLEDYKALINSIFGEGSCYCLKVRTIGGITF